MNKIYISGNYVIVLKDGLENLYPQTKTNYTEAIDHFLISSEVSNKSQQISYSKIGEWFEEDGATPFTIDSLKDFLRTNTGFKNGGGNGDSEGVTIEDNFIRAGRLFSTNDDAQIFTFDTPFLSDDGSQDDDIVVQLNREISGQKVPIGATEVTLTGFTLNRDDAIDGTGTSEPFSYIAVNSNSLPSTSPIGVGGDIDITSLVSNNSGQIKINWTETTKPSITGVVDGVSQPLILNNNYSISAEPTTTFPYLSNRSIGGQNCINPNTLLLREILEGQVITFRIELGYTGKAANQQGVIILNISNPNPLSSFSENLEISALRGRTGFTEPVEISVIADSLSTNPLYGYELSVVTEFTDNNMDIFIENIVLVYNSVELFNK